MRRALALVVVALGLAVPATACAASPDSLAPKTAPPHWLPPEAWVYNHWLPFDEQRLYDALGTDRAGVWRQLRDDHRTLAQLVVARGEAPAAVAARLVEPWRGHVSAARLATLRDRAERVLTQGHLAQHVLFHSLHQFAIPSAAGRVFGVPDVEFRALRRTELSPFEIAALHGRSPGDVLRMCTEILRDRALAGIAGHATTPAQGRLQLRRQLAQLPRWLGQARYNGPPVTHLGALLAKPRDYASNPQLSGDGSRVAFEVYRQKLDDLLAKGEIAVETRDAGAAQADLASPAALPARPSGPQSSYNATISGDGQLVAFESAAGNRNFGKRYGDIGVFVRDLGSEHVSRNLRARQRGTAPSRSAWAPALAADGRHLVYQEVDHVGRTVIRVADLATGQSTAVATQTRTMTPIEPDISADGSRVAYTAALAHGSRVEVVDVATGKLTRVPRAFGTFASQPDLSADARYVTYVAGTAGEGTNAVVVALDGSAPVRVGQAGETGAVRPVVSGDGSFVAFTEVLPATRRVLVLDVRNGTTEVVSRAGADGPEADRPAGDPSISNDGNRIAFVSAATNLDDAKPDDTRGVFVRDRRAGTTTLMSAPSAAGIAPPVAAATAIPAGPAGAILVADNAFSRSHLTIPAGTALDFHWVSTQSHNVTVLDGPETFRVAARNHHGADIRPVLDAPGRYTLVCTLHEPGMRLTVDVR